MWEEKSNKRENKMERQNGSDKRSESQQFLQNSDIYFRFALKFFKISVIMMRGNYLCSIQKI